MKLGHITTLAELFGIPSENTEDVVYEIAIPMRVAKRNLLFVTLTKRYCMHSNISVSLSV
jgi:hypothetical protein